MQANSQRKRAAFPYLFSPAILRLLPGLLCVILLLTNCDSPPASVPQRINAPYRPFRIVQACIQPSPYPAVSSALDLLASWLEADVNVNQQGLVAFTNFLDGAGNTAAYTVSTVSIQALGADPPLPPLRPMPTPLPGRPEDTAALLQQTERANTAALQRYRDTLSRQHDALQRARTQVKAQTAKLRQLAHHPPRLAHPSEDLWGCAGVASLRFGNNAQAQHILLIAADISALARVSRIALVPLPPNTRVVVYDRFCSDVAVCLTADRTLTSSLVHAGVAPAAIAIADTAESQLLPPPF